MIGEVGTRCSLSVHLPGEGKRLSLSCMLRTSPYKRHMREALDIHDEQCNGHPGDPTLVSIARKEYMCSGEDMLIL